MKQVILLHNPGAGDEDHLQKELVETIEKEGYGCVYFAVKEDNSWKHQLEQADIAVVAGGDGTVRRVVKELLQRKVIDKKIPLAILPMGTANNLAKAMGIEVADDHKSHIRYWKQSRPQHFDIGIIKNMDTTCFFLESAGFGAFPTLMQRMKTADKKDVDTAEDKLKLARQVLLDIVLHMDAAPYRIKTDSATYEGSSLLLEVMNISSLGPNLVLAGDAKTDDGVFDIVSVEESQREDYADYLRKLIKGDEATFPYRTFTAAELSIDTDSRDMHMDDELIVPSKNPVVFQIREKILDFLVFEQKDS